MTWEEVTELLLGQDWTGVKTNLERITELMRLAGDPQKKLRYLHIAGSNGKGSAAAMLSEILIRSGYRTGRYISPHLNRMNERYTIDGREISNGDLAALARELSVLCRQMEEKPTNYEMLTALAFLYFERRKCDIVVLEVGLGGRFDATNVIEAPLVSLIMHIALEHTEQLGDTITKIASEKGGIVKQGCDTVLYAQSPEAEEVIRRICEEHQAPLVITDPSKLAVSDPGLAIARPGAVSPQIFDYKDRKGLELSLLSCYQPRNAAVVLETVDLLRRKHGFDIPEQAVRDGLRQVRWPGRFQILTEDPLFVLDGAHNPDGCQALAESIGRYFGGRRIILLMGVMADKNYRRMLDIMAGAFDPSDPGAPVLCTFIALAPEGNRALPADALEAEIRARFDCPVMSCGGVAAGVTAAREVAAAHAEEDPVILAFGSLYQAGEILEIMHC